MVVVFEYSLFFVDFVLEFAFVVVILFQFLDEFDFSVDFVFEFRVLAVIVFEFWVKAFIKSSIKLISNR